MNKTDICNMAVSFLGGNLLTNVDEDASIEAELCRANYDISRLYCLEERDWTFASAMRKLTSLSDAPDFGYSAQFLLPSDCLVVRSVSATAALSNNLDYLKQQKYLYTNSSTVYLRYTRNEQDSELFSSGFIFALAYKLASLLALPLTSSADIQKAMEALAIRYMDESGGIDGMQSKVTPMKRGSLIGVRYNSY
jgi:hypothetical protein